MWRYWLLQKMPSEKLHFFLQKWLFLAEFLSDDNIYAWVFLFDQVCIQVLSPIETHVEVDGLGYTPLSSLSSFV